MIFDGWSDLFCIGISIVNLVPLVGVVRNFILLLCWSRMVFTMERPNPVPFVAGLVVKNGSKILFLSEGFIPLPLSETAISI